MAESHSDFGAAAAQEEAEESPDVGTGSVLSARQVTSVLREKSKTYFRKQTETKVNS